MCKAEKIEKVMNANDETVNKRAAMMLNIRECHQLSQTMMNRKEWSEALSVQNTAGEVLRLHLHWGAAMERHQHLCAG
jgi:hypothetical protein